MSCDISTSKNYSTTPAPDAILQNGYTQKEWNQYMRIKKCFEYTERGHYIHCEYNDDPLSQDRGCQCSEQFIEYGVNIQLKLVDEDTQTWDCISVAAAQNKINSIPKALKN